MGVLETMCWGPNLLSVDEIPVKETRLEATDGFVFVLEPGFHRSDS